MPDPNEVPIKIPDDILSRIGEAAGAYAEERLEDIAPGVPESVTSRVKEIVTAKLTGKIEETPIITVPVDFVAIIGMKPNELLLSLLRKCLRRLLGTKLLSKYFEKMFEESFDLSYDLEDSHGLKSPLKEYYTWLIDVAESMYNEARNLIVENLIEGPLRPESALDTIVDLAVIETFAESDHEILNDLKNNITDLEFSRIRLPHPPHPLNEDELMSQICTFRIVISSTPVDVVASSASCLLGLSLLSSILINRGVSKEWIIKTVELNEETLHEFSIDSDFREIITKIAEGRGEDIVKGATERVLKRLKSKLKRSVKKGSQLSEIGGLDDVEQFLAEVARRVAGIAAENVQLARTLLVDERERFAENLLSCKVLRIGDEIIPPEALDPGWKEAGSIESIDVGNLAEKAVEEIMDNVLDIARKATRLEDSGNERSSKGFPSEGSSGDRKVEGSLSDFAWDVARAIMKEIIKGLSSDERRRRTQ